MGVKQELFTKIAVAGTHQQIPWLPFEKELNKAQLMYSMQKFLLWLLRKERLVTKHLSKVATS